MTRPGHDVHRCWKCGGAKPVNATHSQLQSMKARMRSWEYTLPGWRRPRFFVIWSWPSLQNQKNNPLLFPVAKEKNRHCIQTKALRAKNLERLCASKQRLGMESGGPSNTIHVFSARRMTGLRNFCRKRMPYRGCAGGFSSNGWQRQRR